MIGVYLVCAYFFGAVIGFVCGYIMRMATERKASPSASTEQP